MRASTSICQQLPHSPRRVIEIWQQNDPSNMAQLYQDILTGPSCDSEKVMAIFMLFFLDRYQGQRIAKTPRAPSNFRFLLTQQHLIPDDWLNFYKLYRPMGIRPNVYRALELWHANRDRAVLLTTIPTPKQVLHMQCQKKRPVGTCKLWQDRMLALQDKADAFAFLTHDLEHLFHFLHDQGMHDLQVGFFRWLRSLFHQHPLMQSLDPRWIYLISDMTTHPLHSLNHLLALAHELPTHESINWGHLVGNSVMPSEVKWEFLSLLEKPKAERPLLMQHWAQLAMTH